MDDYCPLMLYNTTALPPRQGSEATQLVRTSPAWQQSSASGLAKGSCRVDRPARRRLALSWRVGLALGSYWSS